MTIVVMQASKTITTRTAEPSRLPRLLWGSLNDPGIAHRVHEAPTDSPSPPSGERVGVRGPFMEIVLVVALLSFGHCGEREERRDASRFLSRGQFDFPTPGGH